MAGDGITPPSFGHDDHLGAAEAAVPGSPLPDLALGMIEAILGP
jgi:hypothetical protein